MSFITDCIKDMALDPKTLSVEKKALYMPPLQEVADALNKSLKSNFAEVNVEVVDSPDLTQEPFSLASKGLGGKTKIVDIGGPPYLLPVPDREKVYDLKDVVKLVHSNPAFIIGAGAGPHPYVGVNCEGILNLNVINGTVDQHTRISKVDQNDANSIQEILPNSESRLALLANLFISEGKPGKVLKVHVKKRIGPDDFIASIRKTLEEAYKDDFVEGKAKQHVMRDFSKTPLENENDLNNWLKFYNMSAPLIAVGTLVNRDGDLDLRVQHFHSFSDHGEAGHYHIDVTPETVEYLGYFNTGEEIYRIDKPAETHAWGRD
ncbi:hypothetical protein NQ314_013907 [Rhamnusium bicolor]|uniref:DUF1907 domain-containing protein n=1 Tax=Rhamnusium bicolor TaxID=1586634 RepID=A0AAV8X528_9CUCU|nr:hypothetical protein NQ314_013907 [Rhamnusium bicolor]